MNCRTRLLLLHSLSLLIVESDCGYWDSRNNFLREERNLFLGEDIVLNADEELVNATLMKAKEKEYWKGFEDPAAFPPARHFFQAREDIEKSEVFRFIKVLPKGACLHGHHSAMVSSEFLLKNLTYMPNLYICEDAEGVTLFRFFEKPDESCAWKLLSDLRLSAVNVTALDEELGRHLTLFTPNPTEVYPDINSVWDVFEKITRTVDGLIYYKPAYERHFYQMLKEFHHDNVMYIELRSGVSGVFELNGSMLPEAEIVGIMRNIVQEFISDHPDFWGIKIIYTTYRQLELAEVEAYISNALKLKKQYPDFIAGFDLVGQEDLGKPLKDFVDLLLTVKDDIKFFFHAGETDWEGITDLNLLDAVLLNTTRIGHGYAILKHPLVLEAAKQRGIAIEVNPISNQVLLLVADLRNHPAATLIAENYPVVISSDDPGFWGAKGLSYDMYETFMGLAGLEADLRVLKKLALNSLRYSALEEEEKDAILSAWDRKWNKFVDSIVNYTDHHDQVLGIASFRGRNSRIRSGLA